MFFFYPGRTYEKMVSMCFNEPHLAFVGIHGNGFLYRPRASLGYMDMVFYTDPMLRWDTWTWFFYPDPIVLPRLPSTTVLNAK